jgi:hypothetical protein
VKVILPYHFDGAQTIFDNASAMAVLPAQESINAATENVPIEVQHLLYLNNLSHYTTVIQR